MPENKFNDDSKSDFKRESKTPSSWNKVYPEVRKNENSASNKDYNRYRDRDQDRDRSYDRGRDRDRSYDRDKDREKSDRDSRSVTSDFPRRKPPVLDQNEKVIAIKTVNDLGNKPIAIICPFCEEKVVTDVEYKAGGGTWAFCGGITAIGLCNPLIWGFCLCWVPFCIPKCKNTKHFCHNCRKYLGTNKVI